MQYVGKYTGTISRFLYDGHCVIGLFPCVCGSGGEDPERASSHQAALLHAADSSDAAATTPPGTWTAGTGNHHHLPPPKQPPRPRDPTVHMSRDSSCTRDYAIASASRRNLHPPRRIGFAPGCLALTRRAPAASRPSHPDRRGLSPGNGFAPIACRSRELVPALASRYARVRCE